LQERCGKQAAARFEQKNGSGLTETKDATATVIYQNHYSPTLNKCFILEARTLDVRSDDKVSSTEYRSLLDFNEKKVYGFFV